MEQSGGGRALKYVGGTGSGVPVDLGLGTAMGNGAFRVGRHGRRQR